MTNLKVPFPSRYTPRMLLLISALATMSCSSTNGGEILEGGIKVSELPAVPYRIGIAPPKLIDPSKLSVSGKGDDIEGQRGNRHDAGIGGGNEGDSQEGALRFAFDDIGFQAELVRVLSKLNAAVAVGAIDAEDAKKASYETWDLIIHPEYERPSLAYDGMSSGWLGSTSLWLLTWYFGTIVDDSQYMGSLKVTFKVKNYKQDDFKTEKPALSESFSLDYWDRKHGFVSGVLTSFFIPPILSADNQELTSAAISRRMVRKVAGDLKIFLAYGSFKAIEKSQRLGHLVVEDMPGVFNRESWQLDLRNDTRKEDLKCTLLSEAEPGEIAISVQRIESESEKVKTSIIRQRKECVKVIKLGEKHGYETKFTVNLDALRELTASGETFLVIEVEIDNLESRKTIRLLLPPKPNGK